MKSYIVFSLLFSGWCVAAQTGIAFHTSSWDEAVGLARAEDKLIFVDGYTTWCAPCKVMEEFVFTQPDVGDYFNEAFINLHLDMEKGAGPLIGLQHGVKTYPTMLFLTWDGTLVSTREGYQGVDDLIRMGQSANLPRLVSSKLDERYESGDRKPDLLYHLTFDRMGRDGADYESLIPQYLKAQRDWLSADGISYIFRFVEAFDSDLFRHMAEHPYAYAEVVGQDEYSKKFNAIVKEALNPPGRTITLEEREAIYEVAYPESADRMMIDYRMQHFAATGQDEAYSEAAYAYYTDFGSDDREGLAKDLALLERYRTTPEERDQITQWYRSFAAGGSSEELLSLGDYYVRIGAYEDAKSLKVPLKKALKAEGGDKRRLKTFLKSVKKAERG